MNREGLLRFWDPLSSPILQVSTQFHILQMLLNLLSFYLFITYCLAKFLFSCSFRHRRVCVMCAGQLCGRNLCKTVIFLLYNRTRLYVFDMEKIRQNQLLI